MLQTNMIINFFADLTAEFHDDFVTESVAQPLCFQEINFQSDFHGCLLQLFHFDLQRYSYLTSTN